MKFAILFVACCFVFSVCHAEPSHKKKVDDEELYTDLESTQENDPRWPSTRFRYRRLIVNPRKLRNKIIKKLLKPTCLGCAGICERKVPGKCKCVTDRVCLRRRFGDEKMKSEDEDEDIEEQDPRWGKIIRWALRPSCAGCAGICEYKVPGRCACRTDQNCWKRRRGDQVINDIISGKISLDDDDEE